MTSQRYLALDTTAVEAVQAGGLDSNGQAPERHVSDGGGNPCRHCLTYIQGGQAMLIIGHRPFPVAQPYAESGPLFIHAHACTRHAENSGFPEALKNSADFILRGYGHDDRIVYGTGAVVATSDIPARATELFTRDDIAFLHLRSTPNNCYQLRIERG
jgi:hypothetical protein